MLVLSHVLSLRPWSIEPGSISVPLVREALDIHNAEIQHYIAYMWLSSYNAGPSRVVHPMQLTHFYSAHNAANILANLMAEVCAHTLLLAHRRLDIVTNI